MPSRVPPSTQLSLNLNQSPPTMPIKVPEEAVSALADLFLAAVRRGEAAPRKESGDE
jgi:hypothetical protein